MGDAPLVRLEREDGLARITLDRPQAGNAISLELCRQIHAAVRACADDMAVRAVLLKSEGPAFCVGGDLVEFEQVGPGRPDHIGRLAPLFHEAQRTLMTLRAPVVVAVQGAAAGAASAWR